MPRMRQPSITRTGMPFFCLWFAGFLLACGSESARPPEGAPEEAVAVNWTWKRTVKNDVNVIYGTVQNKTDQSIKEVVLEFRTQSKAGETLSTRTFSIQDLPAGGSKPFTQDYPAQEAREDSGFVKVLKVVSTE